MKNNTVKIAIGKEITTEEELKELMNEGMSENEAINYIIEAHKEKEWILESILMRIRESSEDFIHYYIKENCLYGELIVKPLDVKKLKSKI